MRSVFRSVGHGLLAAGVMMIVVQFVAAYLRGPDAFKDALDPLAATTYLALLPLLPGAAVLWLAELRLGRRQRAPSSISSSR